MKKLITFILMFQLACPVLADCPDAVLLKVGETVKDCERIGLSIPAEKRIKEDLIKGDYNAKIVESQAGLLTVKDLVIKEADNRSEILKKEVTREREALDAERNRTKWEFWVGFGLGALAVVAGGWALGQASK